MPTENKITPEQLELLRHTLGLNYHDLPTRNHFLASAGSSDMADLRAIEAASLMTSRAAPSFCTAGDISFYANDAGRVYAMQRQPKPKEKTNYDRFMDADTDCTFAEFMGIEKPKIEYESYDRQGNQRMKSSKAIGAWCPSRKDAKASYKAALKANKAANVLANGWAIA